MAATARTKRPTLVRSLTSSVRAATWLTSADQATVDLAYRFAWQLDTARDNRGPDEADKFEGWLMPQYLSALKELGLTPAARKAVKAPETTKRRVDDIRKRLSVVEGA